MSFLKASFSNNRWWIGRVAVLPIHLLVFATAAFLMVRAIPGDPARIVAGPEASDEVYQQVRQRLGLDGSVWEQYLGYMGMLLRLDLGQSFANGRPVITEIGVRLMATLEMALLAFVVLSIVSLVLSGFVVTNPRGAIARFVNGYSQAAGSLPVLVVGVAGIFLFYATLRIVPAPNGRLDPGLQDPPRITGMPFLDAMVGGHWQVAGSISAHYALPILVLVIETTPLLLKQLLVGLRIAAEAPPTMFRVATGASRATVIISTYRRALPAAVSMIGQVFGGLIGGAVVLQSLFALGGLGTYAVTAVQSKDLIALQGVLLVIAFIALVVFLFVDLVNMSLDPRRRPGITAEAS